MFIFPVFGFILIAFGLLFLFSPTMLLSLTRVANTFIPLDRLLFRHRFIVGSILFLGSVTMYYISRTIAASNIVMMTVTIFLGVLFLTLAILLIFVPRWAKRMNDIGGKVIATDEVTIVYRKATGSLLILVGLFMFYTWMR